jgi:hypothetical protein
MKIIKTVAFFSLFVAVLLNGCQVAGDGTGPGKKPPSAWPTSNDPSASIDEALVARGPRGPY